MLQTVRTKSVLLATCKKCCLVYEVEGLQSHFVCDRCNPIRKCAHGVRITIECRSCVKVHGNRLIRVF